MTNTELSQVVGRIRNLSAFARASGVSRTTLWRVAANADHPMSVAQRFYLEAALKKHKPLLREPGEPVTMGRPAKVAAE